jgi:hypothetical protein
VQLIENLQREDLHELAEAEGYEALLKQGMTAEEIAAKVAKSKSHVYARMKLIALAPAVRVAFYDGTVNASVALLIARIPVHELQERALKRITEIDPYHKEPMSVREAQDYVRDEFTLKLAGAPFPREDATLCPKAGACGECPKRTGNQPADLFGDIKSADVCTDPVCFRSKRDAHQKRELEKAKATGTTVIGARQARRIMPEGRGYFYSSDGAHKQLRNGYARPSDTCLDDPKKRTYAELAGKDAPTVLIQDPDNGRVFKAFELEAIADRVKAKGVKPKPKAVDRNEQRAQDRERQEQERVEKQNADVAVFKAIFPKVPPKFAREDLLAIALRYFSEGYGDSAARMDALGWEAPKNPKAYMGETAWLKYLDKLTEAELIRVIIVAPALDGIEDGYGDTPELLTLAKRFSVDAKAIRKSAKATAEKPAEKKPTKRAKK